MATSEASPELKTNEATEVGTSEHEVAISAVLKRDMLAGRFNHRSCVDPGPAPVEPLYSD